MSDSKKLLGAIDSAIRQFTQLERYELEPRLAGLAFEASVCIQMGELGRLMVIRDEVHTINQRLEDLDRIEREHA